MGIKGRANLEPRNPPNWTDPDEYRERQVWGRKVVCVKFSKLVMVRVGWFIQVNESSIPLFDRKGLSLRPDHLPAERRAQRQSRMSPRLRRHWRSRRAASLTERARC